MDERGGGEAGAGILGHPDFGAGVVGEEIGAIKGGVFVASVDIAACDGDAGVGGVVVFEDGAGESIERGVIRVIDAWAAGGAFHDAPAEVDSAWRVCGLEIDFFAVALADVSHVKVTGFGIEGVSPRIPQAVVPDFRAGGGMGGVVVEGIFWRLARAAFGDGVIFGGVGGKIVLAGIYAEDFSQEFGQVLGVAHVGGVADHGCVGGVLIVGIAAVACGDVEVMVWAESEPAAVVVGLRLVDLEDGLGGGGAGGSEVGGGVLNDLREALSEGAACGGVIEVEFTVGGVVGVEGHAEEALFAASGGHAGGQTCNCDEWGGVEGVGVQVEDSHAGAAASALLDHEEMIVIAWRSSDENWLAQACL